MRKPLLGLTLGCALGLLFAAAWPTGAQSLPQMLGFGRTAGGVNVPLLVDSQGRLATSGGGGGGLPSPWVITADALSAPDGTVGAPVYTFLDAPLDGFYWDPTASSYTEGVGAMGVSFHVSPPLQPSAGTGSSASVSNGVHKIYVTWVNTFDGTLETLPSPVRSITISSNRRITISPHGNAFNTGNLPYGAQAMNIYITKAGEVNPENSHLAGQLTMATAVNGAFVFTDDDSTLTGDPPPTEATLTTWPMWLSNGGLRVRDAGTELEDEFFLIYPVYDAAGAPAIRLGDPSYNYVTFEPFGEQVIPHTRTWKIGSAAQPWGDVFSSVFLDGSNYQLKWDSDALGVFATDGTTPAPIRASGVNIAGLTSPADKPVCFDASGNLYAGTNAAGVLSCP